MSPLPVLLHIGYHKTATTWWQRDVMPSHPEIIPIGDESTIAELIVYPDDLHFDPLQSRSALMPESIGELEGVVVLSCERLSGAPLAGGYDAVPVANRLAESFPEARVWIVVRNQVDLLVSLYKHSVCWDGNVMPLEVFLRDDPPALVPGVRLDHFKFDRLVSHYQLLFGVENVLVSTFESLVQSPGEFLRTVSRFMGMSEIDLSTVRKRNKSFSDLSVETMRILNHFSQPLENERYTLTVGSYPVVRLFSRRQAHRLLRRLDRLRPWAQTDLGLKEQIESIVGDQFAASNQRLEEIASLDLRALGYVL